MLGAAAAIIILAIGIAARLAARPPVEPTAPAPIPASLREVVVPPPDRPDIIVRAYVIFSEASVTLAGIEFLVQAGHRFENERSESFSTAWCYTKRFVGGVEINLSLGSLEPDAVPVPAEPAVSDGSRRAMNLSEADVGTLYSQCPWLQVGP